MSEGPGWSVLSRCTSDWFGSVEQQVAPHESIFLFSNNYRILTVQASSRILIIKNSIKIKPKGFTMSGQYNKIEPFQL